MSEKKQSNFKYSENHNKILRSISELMRVEFKFSNRITGEIIEKQDYENLDEDEKVNYSDYLVEPPFPTAREVADHCEMTPSTVTKHIKQMTLENFKGTAQALIPQVIASLGRTAIREGKAPEAKLFLQVVGGFEEKSKIDSELSGEITVKTKRTIITKSK